MITSRTKKQLMIFVILTLVGVSYVGARYARLERVVFDSRYVVTAAFTDSGGIFKGAEVTYRGVGVGQVTDLRLTRQGIDVEMSIEGSEDKIPADAFALVGNKSAVGEQYVELQPKTDTAPYLKDGSRIANGETGVPIQTVELLTNLDNLVNSVPQGDLRTVVSEAGAAFVGTGTDLAQIIDTSNAFIQAADANFETTSALIEDSNVVLRTQVDKTSAIRSFSRDLALFSGTLAGSDKDLRRLIDNGGASATELRVFLQKNGVNLGQLINNLVTTGQVVVKHLKGIRQLLVLYPYIVEGAYSVVGKGPDGKFDANFGLVFTGDPAVCHQGYEGTDRRTPSEIGDDSTRGGQGRSMNTEARCTEPPSKSNARGTQNSPNNRVGTTYRAPAVATYDQDTGKVNWTDGDDDEPEITYAGGARDTFGKDSWKWLLLQPVAAKG